MCFVWKIWIEQNVNRSDLIWSVRIGSKQKIGLIACALNIANCVLWVRACVHELVLVFWKSIQKIWDCDREHLSIHFMFSVRLLLCLFQRFRFLMCCKTLQWLVIHTSNHRLPSSKSEVEMRKNKQSDMKLEYCIHWNVWSLHSELAYQFRNYRSDVLMDVCNIGRLHIVFECFGQRKLITRILFLQSEHFSQKKQSIDWWSSSHRAELISNYLGKKCGFDSKCKLKECELAWWHKAALKNFAEKCLTFQFSISS